MKHADYNRKYGRKLRPKFLSKIWVQYRNYVVKILAKFRREIVAKDRNFSKSDKNQNFVKKSKF